LMPTAEKKKKTYCIS